MLRVCQPKCRSPPFPRLVNIGGIVDFVNKNVRTTCQTLKISGVTVMKVAEFYSVNETKKPATQRVHHNNNACPPGRDIPQNERRAGTGNYRLCEDCARLNRQGR